jgi:hypothetical protein
VIDLLFAEFQNSSFKMGFFKIFIFAITVALLSFKTLQHTFASVHGNDAVRLLEQITNSAIIERTNLIGFRIFAFSVILFTVLNLLFDSNVRIIAVNLLDTSDVPKRIGREVFLTFTVWCWIVQGIYFSSTLALHFIPGMPNWFIQMTMILFEISLSVSILVTFIVSFVLIPKINRDGIDLSPMVRPISLIMHNANILFMTTELLFNRIEMDIGHLPFSILFGLLYVINAWALAYKSGFFFYFFLNYNFKHALLSHTALVSILGVFFAMAYFVGQIFEDSNLYAIPVLYGLALSICMIRTPAEIVKPAKTAQVKKME